MRSDDSSIDSEAQGFGDFNRSAGTFQASNLSLVKGPPEGLYADEDSEVSSNVTPFQPNEPQSLPDSGAPVRGAQQNDSQSLMRPQELPQNRQVVFQERGGILPSTKKEWCIIIFAIIIILAVALGIGLGVGLGLGGNDGSSNGDNDRGISGGETIPDEPGRPSTEPSWAPSSVPTQSPTSEDDLQMNKDYFVISSNIQKVVAFGSGQESLDEAQQNARDFLVLGDFVPLELEDDNDDNDDNDRVQSDDNGGGSVTDQLGQSYLTIKTPAYRVVQRYALATLFYATEGENWETNTNWLEPAVHECEWIGVTCTNILIPSVSLEENLRSPNEIPLDKDGNVPMTTERVITEINLTENQLKGTLPVEVGAMPYLESLNVWENKIAGDIPTDVGNLSRLRVVHLDANEFVGTIPTEFGQCTDMLDLSLYRNTIRGDIPTEIGLLTGLKRLWLSDMNLRGKIPTELGELEDLMFLYLDGNRLRGEIPTEIGNLVNMKEIRLEKNSLGGSVPCGSLGPDTEITADCKNDSPVTCYCCTECT